MRPTALLAAACLAACSTGGGSGDGMRGLPSNGAGPFRQLDSDEVPFGLATPGRGGSVENGMVLPGPTDAVLFYTFAPSLDVEPTDGGPPPDLFGPREIRRSPPFAGPQFPEGPTVFAAAEPWEAGEVFDPWAVALPDGRVRLYYAAGGGIGAAEGPGRDGPWTRTPGAPLLGPDPAIAGGAVPRRPTVVDAGDRIFLYYEAGDAIWAATSADGLAFTREPAPLDLSVPRDAGFVETRVAAPGAVRITTPIGREVTRLYFESHRADGSRALALAGSEDGLHFDRGVPPVFMDAAGEAHEGTPAPWVRDARTTLLYYSVDRTTPRRMVVRGLAVGVSPGNVRFEL